MMRRVTLAAAVLLAAACESIDCGVGRTPAIPPPAQAPSTPQQQASAIRVSGSRFLDARGQPFDWRGITAFRLAEMIESGNQRDAVAYLDWAQREQLTVVRVLLMAQHLFKLAPESGRAALPKLLELAKARGLTVEVVALADTQGVSLDYETHVREIGRIAAQFGNAFVELANEPGHPTQDPRVHDPAFLQKLAALLPDAVPFALGSVEYGEGFADGDYATAHLDRGRGDWDHVLAIATAARRVTALGKPLVSDEPIGAGPEYHPGRRDNDPSRFAAAAALTRLAGLGATFHYEGGLQARIPAGREAACLAAWQLGLALLNDVPLNGEFVDAARLSQVAQFSQVRGAFGRVSSTHAVILLIDPSGARPATLASGWTEVRRAGVPGVQLLVAAR